MTPDQLAALHPHLFHLTDPDSLERIEGEGLLSPEAMCDRVGVDDDERNTILATRRPTRMRVGHYHVNDNAPLSLSRLAPVLDDGLTPEAWLRMLNARVFLWTSRRKVEALRGARNNRARPKVLLTFDTVSLARDHIDRMEATPMNTGAALRVPPRRGPATFAPLVDLDYDTWRTERRMRGLKKGLDTIVEVTIRYALPNAWNYVTRVDRDA